MRSATTLLLAALALSAVAQNSDETVVVRLEPQRASAQIPRAMEPAQTPLSSPVHQRQMPPTAQQPRSVPQVPAQVPQGVPQSALGQTIQVPQQVPAQPADQVRQVHTVASPPGIRAQSPNLTPSGLNGQQEFTPRDNAVPPQAPPMNIPPDVQNQLIKFFGLDSFGIPGLTGNHPNGFAGAVQEMRAAGIPLQGLPLDHVAGQPVPAGANPQQDLLAQANPSFGMNNIMNDASNVPHSAASIPLPDAKPGENGLIGLLSSSIRKLVKDSGVADALAQGLPNVLGTNTPAQGTPTSSATAAKSFSQDEIPMSAASPDVAVSASSGAVNAGGVRRQQSTAERALSGFAAALGGGGQNGPSHAGLPRIPGLPILPGGIPRNAQGQIDVVNLIGSITRRVSNGTTLADVLPPEQLQTLADNVTDALLPATPEDFDLNKFMGRWFEGINSPRSTEQRCIVHHYGGLTKNDKTATFTALKIYREGSEFGSVRYSIGYAFRAGNKDAMLQLHSSENSDAQPFWVYKLGPEGTDPFGNKQYEYAIVSNWVKYPVTVLVRDPDSFKQKYEIEVLRWLEDQGFINGFVRAFNLLQPASYSSCQYAENTFELFGKK
ncbi:unnamed protein product [Bursaphelenchus okinawaensis]|uniref:Lipocalin domain-containing protein n=1 Tax=Bursaphelenchus okinawaensis TaxID=465554 RepID=A0A811KLN2_9BILA|nr:unnamed protein product [Bursaphelenchus okinawaensis]CAG9107149.1 unnamed protein product [Bursaphelenchus okinawaensis]